MRLPADIIGGQLTTILRDGMPEKVNPAIYGETVTTNLRK